MPFLLSFIYNIQLGVIYSPLLITVRSSVRAKPGPERKLPLDRTSQLNSKILSLHHEGVNRKNEN